MRHTRLLMTGIALSLLVGCGDKQPPATTDPGSSLGDSSTITPIVTPTVEPTFNPNDQFDPGTAEPTPDPNVDPNAEPTPDPNAEPTPDPNAEPTPEPTESVEPTPEPTPAVAAPASLTSSSIGLTGFTVGWTGPSNAVSYRIFLDGTLQVDNVQGNVYALTGLTQGKEYAVTLTALDANGAESAQSTPLTVSTTSISVPTNLAQSDLVYNGAKLTWSAASSATSYSIYVNDSKVADGVTATSYTLTGLTPETDYSVAVTASTADGESVKSEAVTFTTPKMPDPYGNERLGFLNMSALENAEGLDVKNGHAYVGYLVIGSNFFTTNKRYVRDLTLSSGVVKDTTISTQGETKVAGVAVNAAVIWAVTDQFDKDGYNLYKYNISGSLLKRSKLGATGEILSDVAVDPASGLVYIASRTHNSIIKFNDATNDAVYKFTGATGIDPLGVAVDSAGDIYTFDSITQKIIKFSKADGSRLLEFGPKGVNNTGEIYTAVSDLSVDARNGDIYISGNAGGTVKIFRYDSAGNFIRSFSDKDLVDPRKLTVDVDGKVYIVDATKKGVLVFSPGIKP